MKRHIGLQPLSHDHHEGLVHAYRMTKAGAGERDAASVADEYLTFVTAGLDRHFREEEDVLVPALPEGDAQRLRLLRDHRRIEALTRSLRAARGAGADLAPTLAALGEALEVHIRFEERELFPRLESDLSEEDLNAMGRRFAGGASCRVRGGGPAT